MLFTVTQSPVLRSFDRLIPRKPSSAPVERNQSSLVQNNACAPIAILARRGLSLLRYSCAR